MRLTYNQRRRFVNSVMEAVPRDDSRIEQAQALLQSAAESLMPEEAVKLFRKRPDWLMTHYHCVTTEVEVPGYSKPRVISHSFRVSGPDGVLKNEYRGYARLNEAVKALLVQHYWLDEERNGLRAKLNAAVEGCRTLKQLKEKFPELEEHMPKPPEPLKTPPVSLREGVEVQQIISELREKGLKMAEKGANDGG